MGREKDLTIPLMVGGVAIGVVILYGRKVGAVTDASVKLSPHFSLAEFVPKGNRAPTSTEVANLAKLAGLLERLRERIGKPISIRSGLRDISKRAKVNQALREKGYEPATDSDHFYGQAADLSWEGATPGDYGTAAAWLAAQPETREVIAYDRHIHIAVKGPGRSNRLADNDKRGEAYGPGSKANV